MEYYINLIYSIFVFIIGTLFGSFFTLAIYRIPRHQDIVKTRSYCPNCKHRLGFFDCFPILSYISTIGRCRYCKKPISIRYPLIEFASGMVFLIIFLIFGLSLRALILVACYVYLFLVIGTDVMRKKMTKEEIEEVENIKKNKKAGAINIDIVVAMIIFTMFFISTIFTVRNYNKTLVEYSRKSDALNLCINNINEAKNTDFDSLISNNGTKNIDDIQYTYNIDVQNLMIDGESVDNKKVIESKVSFVLNGKEESISLKCIKVNKI